MHLIYNGAAQLLVPRRRATKLLYGERANSYTRSFIFMLDAKITRRKNKSSRCTRLRFMQCRPGAFGTYNYLGLPSLRRNDCALRPCGGGGRQQAAPAENGGMHRAQQARSAGCIIFSSFRRSHVQRKVLCAAIQAFIIHSFFTHEVRILPNKYVPAHPLGAEFELMAQLEL